MDADEILTQSREQPKLWAHRDAINNDVINPDIHMNDIVLSGHA
jgi:hypothetical protein